MHIGVSNQVATLRVLVNVCARVNMCAHVYMCVLMCVLAHLATVTPQLPQSSRSQALQPLHTDLLSAKPSDSFIFCSGENRQSSSSNLETLNCLIKHPWEKWPPWPEGRFQKEGL